MLYMAKHPGFKMKTFDTNPIFKITNLHMNLPFVSEFVEDEVEVLKVCDIFYALFQLRVGLKHWIKGVYYLLICMFSLIQKVSSSISWLIFNQLPTSSWYEPYTRSPLENQGSV